MSNEVRTIWKQLMKKPEGRKIARTILNLKKEETDKIKKKIIRILK